MEQAVTRREQDDGAAVAMLQPDWMAAIRRHRAGDADGAIACYEKHLKTHPADASAWLNLGAALRKTGRREAALVCYQRLLRLRPLDATVWSNLGNLWCELDQHEQSLRSHRRALQLDPDNIQLRINHAAALRDGVRLDAAEAAFDHCLELQPGRADLLHSLAEVLLLQGRYAEAWPLERAARDARRLACAGDVPAWQGERIGGRHVLLPAAACTGDTLWAARYLRLLQNRGADLTLQCAAELHPVLAALPVHLVTRAERSRSGRPFDYTCALDELPCIVDARGLTLPEPVALVVPDASRERLQQRLARDPAVFRIGFAWSDGEGRRGAGQCPAAPERFLPLAALPGVQLYSLQQGHATSQLNASGAGGFVADLGSGFEHLGDAAAAIEAMDLVISTDNELAHIAACLGTPLLNLLPFRPHWIYGTRSDATPWYPAMRLVRQKAPGDWDSIFREVRHLVANWARIKCPDDYGFDA